MAHNANFVEFDATPEGMELLAAYTIALRYRGQAFTSAYTKCGQVIRVTLI